METLYNEELNKKLLTRQYRCRYHACILKQERTWNK